MCYGGLYWFEDLSVPDPYYILPVVMATTLALQIKLGADGMNVGTVSPLMKKVVYCIPPVMFFVTKDFPAVSRIVKVQVFLDGHKYLAYLTIFN